MQPDDQSSGQHSAQPGQPPRPANGTTTQTQMDQDLGPRVLALAERIVEMERALGMREWWLLGRDLPEAQALSEIGSLLAVARGELAQVLADVFAHPLPSADGELPRSADEGDHSADPEWIAARAAEARHLLDVAATVLPALQQYARVLRSHAERMTMPTAALDAFGIVNDRLDEACELLQHPPERPGGSHRG